MHTILGNAKKNKQADRVKDMLLQESLSTEVLTERIAKGQVVIPYNNKKILKKPCAIGMGLSTKINANIGTSEDASNVNEELQKMKIAEKYGADAVMDLSTGGNLDKIRHEIIQKSGIPVGTVPIYQIAMDTINAGKDISEITIKNILDTIEKHAKDGIDFVTIHAGIKKEFIDGSIPNKRLLGIVSRGGAILLEWMKKNNKQNPFYEHFSEILDILNQYDVTISLGDALRPGCLKDATDNLQINELFALEELAKIANEHNVQVIIEGPGHVPINQIETNILLQKTICNNRPFYVLGPIVTDIAVGYDHIAGAIGGAIAAWHGADFLCYVTPAEHLRLPNKDDVKDGVIASKIAAHAADIAKNNDIQRDIQMSVCRRMRKWTKQAELSLDPEKFALYRKSAMPKTEDVCSMCGNLCSIKKSDEWLV